MLNFGRSAVSIAGIVSIAACLFPLALLSVTPAYAQKSVTSADTAYRHALQIWSGGNQRKAESLLGQDVMLYPTDEKLAFFRAVCVRSRFDINQAAPLFGQIVRQAKQTTGDYKHASAQAKCAALALSLDSHRNPDACFAELHTVMAQNPTDPLPIWLLAIECRSYDRNQEGVAAYQQLLKLVNPGSSLVHQTYANLLEELQRYDEALVSRKIAATLEPAPWSLNALGHTFSNLGRAKEALQAYSECVRLYPNNEDALKACGYINDALHQYREADKAFSRVVQIDPKNADAWSGWAHSYWGRKNFAAAMDKFKHAAIADPTNPEYVSNVAGMAILLGRNQEAQYYRAKAMALEKDQKPK